MKEMRSSDFWVSAFCITRGAKFIKLEKNPAKPAQSIVVIEGEHLEEDAQDYAVNGKVSLLTFRHIFLSLKSSLYNKNQNTYIKGKTNESERPVKI